jgi:hypothetical protein
MSSKACPANGASSPWPPRRAIDHPSERGWVLVDSGGAGPVALEYSAGGLRRASRFWRRSVATRWARFWVRVRRRVGIIAVRWAQWSWVGRFRGRACRRQAGTGWGTAAHWRGW